MEVAPAKSFQNLIVWQKSHALALHVYRVSSRYPKTELYGLTSQVRRAAMSVPANIAEGFKRASRADKARMLNVHRGRWRNCDTTCFWRKTLVTRATLN